MIGIFYKFKRFWGLETIAVLILLFCVLMLLSMLFVTWMQISKVEGFNIGLNSIKTPFIIVFCGIMIMLAFIIFLRFLFVYTHSDMGLSEISEPVPFDDEEDYVVDETSEKPKK